MEDWRVEWLEKETGKGNYDQLVMGLVCHCKRTVLTVLPVVETTKGFF